MMLGSRVREARERLGLSQETLAHQVTITRNTLWYIEAGRTQHPRADQVAELAKALHVSADYLLGLTDDPTPRKRPRARTPARVG
jgi:transcriptional regulator with XRE-family HTH domain